MSYAYLILIFFGDSAVKYLKFYTIILWCGGSFYNKMVYTDPSRLNIPKELKTDNCKVQKVWKFPCLKFDLLHGIVPSIQINQFWCRSRKIFFFWGGGEGTHEEMKILKLGKFSMLHLVQNSLKVFHSGKEFEQEATAGVNYYFSVFFW